MEFFDIKEQTNYKIKVTKPKSVEDLSDLFITKEELKELVGCDYVHGGTHILEPAVQKELQKLADKLDASGKKSIPIEDEDLLTVLKDDGHRVPEFISDKYNRHGDRLCYARQHKRVKKKATKKDYNAMWYGFEHAFRAKFDCWPPYIPRHGRHLPMFRAFKKIIGWKEFSKHISAEDRKWFRIIWDNPEEYV